MPINNIVPNYYCLLVIFLFLLQFCFFLFFFSRLTKKLKNERKWPIEPKTHWARDFTIKYIFFEWINFHSRERGIWSKKTRFDVCVCVYSRCVLGTLRCNKKKNLKPLTSLWPRATNYIPTSTWVVSIIFAYKIQLQVFFYFEIFMLLPSRPFFWLKYIFCCRLGMVWGIFIFTVIYVYSNSRLLGEHIQCYVTTVCFKLHLICFEEKKNNIPWWTYYLFTFFLYFQKTGWQCFFSSFEVAIKKMLYFRHKSMRFRNRIIKLSCACA